mmetsp:Transcript_12887/g.20660  ORF Transcript_12887/g.20660 Transcript_12887/m.20660 type:complete len:110 (+) Transcript_12887:738-1067(+)
MCLRWTPSGLIAMNVRSTLVPGIPAGATAWTAVREHPGLARGEIPPPRLRTIIGERMVERTETPCAKLVGLDIHIVSAATARQPTEIATACEGLIIFGYVEKGGGRDRV